MKTAPNLILVGPMGSGKTSLGKRLAARLGLPFVDADREIERSTGASITLIFELEGEAGFRAREHETLKRLCHGEGRVIATGGGAILHPQTRQLLPERGFVLYLAADPDTQLDRLRHDRSRPLLQSSDRRVVLQRISEERTPLYESVADLRHDTARSNLRRGVEKILTQLQQRWRLPNHSNLDASA